MKEFKLNALNKFGVALMFFFGLMMFSSATFAQTAPTDQEFIDGLTVRKTYYEDMRDTYIQNDDANRAAMVSDVIDHIDTGLALLSNGTPKDLPSDFMTSDVWNKVHQSVLQSYTSAQLSAMTSAKNQLQLEGKTDTPAYHKLEMVLQANGL